MKLSILICSIIERDSELRKLLKNFDLQITNPNEVEILYCQDNKEMSVGAKRQKLLLTAKGDYIVFFDDDDWPMADYIELVLKAIETAPDCVGINVAMTTNGQNPQRCCHSLKYKQWRNNVDGWDYVRNVTHFNPVKRSLALKTGFRNLRFGEDKDYSDRITRLCKTEVYIHHTLFNYRYSNKINHKEKYGIK